jgi:hypothetical protein
VSRVRRALLIALASCATAKSTPPPSSADEVRVEAVALDLLPEGRGTVGFVLDLESPAGESCTVKRVEWQLSLQSRDFAAGVSSASVLVPGGQRARVKVEEPVAFGGMGYDGRARTVPVWLRGEVVTQSGRGEEKKRFAFRTRVAVRGAPVYDR